MPSPLKYFLNPLVAAIILLPLLMAAASWNPARAQGTSAGWQGTEDASARLFTGQTQLDAMGRIWLGVEIKLAPGWKTYWRNPGESGAPPRFDWQGSQNLDRVEVRWPAPHRFSSFGFDSYGYDDGVVLPVFVDLDVGLGRTGTSSAQVAVELAGLITAHPALHYAGVQGYMGHLQHVDDHGERRALLERPSGDLQDIVDALIKANLPPQIVSGGGTGTHRMDADLGTIGEFQVGSYLFMDVQYTTVQQGESGERPYEPSLYVQTSVVNINHPNYAVTDAGLKSFATDGPESRLRQIEHQRLRDPIRPFIQPQHSVAGIDRVLQRFRVIRDSITDRTKPENIDHREALLG